MGQNLNGRSSTNQSSNGKQFNSGIASFDVGGVNKPKQSAFANKNGGANFNQPKTTGFNANLAGFSVARDIAGKKNYHESNTNAASNTLKRESLFKDKSRAQYDSFKNAGNYGSGGAYANQSFGLNNVLVNKHSNSNKTGQTVIVSNDSLSANNHSKLNGNAKNSTNQTVIFSEQNNINNEIKRTDKVNNEETKLNESEIKFNEQKLENSEKILEKNVEQVVDYIDSNVNENHTTTNGNGYFSDIFTEDYNKKIAVNKEVNYNISDNFGTLGKQISAKNSQVLKQNQSVNNQTITQNIGATSQNLVANHKINNPSGVSFSGSNNNGFGSNVNFARNNGTMVKTVNMNKSTRLEKATNQSSSTNQSNVTININSNKATNSTLKVTSNSINKSNTTVMVGLNSNNSTSNNSTSTSSSPNNNADSSRPSSPASRGINKGMFIGLDNNVSSYHKPKLTAEPPKPEQKKRSGLSNGLIDFNSLKGEDNN